MSGKHVLITIAAACVLSVALVGCAGGSASSSAASSAASADAASSAAASAASAEAASSAASDAAASSAEAASAEASSAEAASSEAAGSEASGLSEALVGKWMTYSMTKGDQAKTVDELDEDAKAAMEAQYWVFRDDGTCSMVDEGQDFEQVMNWELDGESVDLIYEGQSFSATGATMTFDGTEITLITKGSDGSDMTVIMRKAE